MKRGKFEGLVLLGAGGSPDEWIRGVSQLLNDEKIAKSGDPKDLWYGAFELKTSGGRTDLALVFKPGLDMGRLAMWRLRFGDASWISDYLVNYAKQHNDIEEDAPKGWEGTVKRMKKHSEIDNPWALAHWMKKKGAEPHYTKKGKKKR